MTSRRRDDEARRCAHACALLATCGVASWLSACDGYADLGTLAPEVGVGDAPPEMGVGETPPSAGGAGVDLPPIAIDECVPSNAAGLDGARLAAARAGGSVSPDARLLYPYDGTVFPAGLAPPLLMWAGARADAIYLRARSPSVRYEGCLLPNAEREVVLPSTLWREAQARALPSGDLLELELTALDGENASGPLRVSIRVSSDPISGVLYYSSYRSLLAGPTNLAAVMRLPLGETFSALLTPAGCAGCHAVSADGTALLASLSGLGNWYDTPNTAGRDPLPAGLNRSGAEFAAIDPSGAFYLAPAHPPLFGPRSLGASPQIVATLFDLASGAAIAGTGIPDGAMTPAFSPDGQWLAFNDGTENGHTLSRVAFSADQRRASDYRVIVSDAELFPAWPTFRPGSEQLIFALGVSSSFSADGTLVSDIYPAPGPRSDLHVAPLDGSGSTLLFRAMGFASEDDAFAERTYLPFGQQDLHQNYSPNVLPNRSGAHDWLFFDSVRNYGNRGLVRGLWCSALDVGEANGTDPSHPPFFVPGQEIGPANLRPIAARRGVLAE